MWNSIRNYISHVLQFHEFIVIRVNRFEVALPFLLTINNSDVKKSCRLFLTAHNLLDVYFWVWLRSENFFTIFSLSTTRRSLFLPPFLPLKMLKLDEKTIGMTHTYDLSKKLLRRESKNQEFYNVRIHVTFLRNHWIHLPEPIVNKSFLIIENRLLINR